MIRTCLSASTAVFVLVAASGMARAGDGMAPPDWSGAYIGAQAGYAMGDVDPRIPAYGSVPNGDIDGFIGGAYAGYNVDVGNSVVVGAEIGGNFLDSSGKNGIGNDPETFTTEQNWEASLVGRLGVPVDSILLYGLGGVSMTEVKGHYVSPIGTAPSQSDTVMGWTVGVGAEMQIAENWRGRIEYRHADYEEADLQCSLCGPTYTSLATDIITLGLAFAW